MKNKNQSLLDDEPLYSATAELLRQGYGVVAIARAISAQYGLNVSKDAVRRFRQRHRIFDDKPYEPQPVSEKKLSLEAVRPPGYIPKRNLVTPHDDSVPELVVVCGDQQAPFHDLGLHKTFCEWLSYNQPSRGVILGDLLDFPDISRHPADPDNVASVQECLQSGYDILVDYISASPDTQWDFLLGNHDIRIQRYIIEKSPLMHNVSRVINRKYPEPEFVHALTHLMRLDELGVNLVTTNGSYEDAQVVLSDKLAVRHGWRVNQGSGVTALKSLQQAGYSIIIGHVHRQSIVYHTSHDINRETTTLVAAEAGCMCRIDGKIDDIGRRFPSYAVLPDWQQGWITATIWDDGKFSIENAVYVNKTALWRGQRYESGV